MAVGDLQKVVGRNLRAYRMEKGLSQEDFAEVVGVHRTYMGGLSQMFNFDPEIAGQHTQLG